LSRFQKEIYPRERPLFERLAEGQNPEALFLTCADSRISIDMITQTRPGDLFICRNAGNIAPPHGESAGGVAATVQYAVEALGVHHIVVCGHSDCGAMRAVLHPEKVAHMSNVAAWLRFAETARAVAERRPDVHDEESLLNAVVEENVLVQLDHLRTTPYVASRVRHGELTLHGWVYDIRSGAVKAYDAETKRFIQVRETGAGPSQALQLEEIHA
jgi:carbonic anhydrase